MVLVLSIIASIIIWGFLSGWKFALVLVGSIFIHEYGHYYWMGREGIKDRDMFFIPPFGAVARSKEMWPTRGSESRISLAGPAFGLISVLIFFILWAVSLSPIFAASVVLASYINLFNLLLPIPILDGGRVIKSILFSINESLGRNFYQFGFIFLGILVLINIISLILAFIISWLLWQEYSSYLRAKKWLAQLDDNTATLKEKEELSLFLYPPSMSPREMSHGLLLFFIISSIYISAILVMSSHIDTDLYSLRNYFK